MIWHIIAFLWNIDIVGGSYKKKRGNSKEPEDLKSLSVALFIYIIFLLGLLYSEFRINGIRNYEAIQTR